MERLCQIVRQRFSDHYSIKTPESGRVFRTIVMPARQNPKDVHDQVVRI
jgi:hypothetical protein